ncbi:predicted protein [Sclerotinia sclerotiorum 1980 UF-70]|uniref:Uncharacterized protein n=1 Tax=Sclerotinia sclerotiorum (strain ATCC 18683 / 1980 / Ss-1) TaxID=665079 RepID=A7EMS0_SCLS1|nr:predicted protein [Sclerotinia sclerotiorum 1980 UF-70]EDO04136.1 predicted protein [Sclerotinia sclerotiorum 1980 UF-70]
MRSGLSLELMPQSTMYALANMSGQYRRESIVQLVSPPLALHVGSAKRVGNKHT